MTAGTALAVLTRPAWAAQKSRTAGYTVQKTEKEWKSILSPIQYNILRQGGTERPGFSILEKEKRPGVFRCAGCDTPLFATADKFNSKTGWPSFMRRIIASVWGLPQRTVGHLQRSGDAQFHGLSQALGRDRAPGAW